jgi:anti-sigma B factor antagonist
VEGLNFMSLKLNTRHVGDVMVIDVSGRITLGEGSSAIRDEMRGLATSGTRKVLLNLEDVSYIDTSGIGELVAGLTSVAKTGGAMKLLNPTRRVKDLLRITNLNVIFDVHEDEARAVRSFT